MIPRLDPHTPADLSVGQYLSALRTAGFRGRTLTRLSERVVRATDNSLYQFLPQAAIEPLDHDDCAAALRLLAEDRFESVTLTARGGGTGTSAMALSHGVVIDFAKMRRVISIDPRARTARVEAGAVLEDLNRAAAEHGLMFAPHVSTADRATIAGMIATDAAGKGSAVYGKTSDHLLSLRALFVGGEELETADVSADSLPRLLERAGRAGELCRTASEIARSDADRFEREFPSLPRRFSGYDLVGMRAADGLALERLLCGSEGTLAIVTQATLRLTPIPKNRSVVAIRYTTFLEAVEDASRLAAHLPHAIETMDAAVLTLARDDEAFPAVEDLVEPGAGALTLVEFAGDSRRETDDQARRLAASSAAASTTTADQAAALWSIRARAVGVLGAMGGRRKPVPFVEDAAVPLDRLPSFIRGFETILEREGLTCGRFGHLDAGVIHIRPALDTTDPTDAELVRRLSDDVADLAAEHAGILWGEHGKGVRAEYLSRYFSDAAISAMRRIKGAADPRNQLNPGKIVAPPDSRAVMLTIDSTMRGNHDRDVPAHTREEFPDPFRCNGNAACHSVKADSVMCPSWKATFDRRHSPKGRADLMREWLRRLALENSEHTDRAGSLLNRLLNRRSAAADFSHEVKESMDGCLACKACAGQCPVKVDVPAFRAEFLHAYHGRYARPLRDSVLAFSERFAGVPAPRALLRALAIADPPHPARPALPSLWNDDAPPPAKPARVREGDVVIVPDAVTVAFAPQTIVSLVRLARALGRTVHMLPTRDSGKGLHVLGMLDRFRRVAERQRRRLAALSHATLVGVDPAMTLLYRDEYSRLLATPPPPVLLPQEWLVRETPPPRSRDSARAVLLAHCSERATAPHAAALWREVFTRFGAELDIQDAGCCGMAGMWGHLAENADPSRRIFEQNWSRHIKETNVLATGVSCRTQAVRCAGRVIEHPLEFLAQRVAQ